MKWRYTWEKKRKNQQTWRKIKNKEVNKKKTSCTRENEGKEKLEKSNESHKHFVSHEIQTCDHFKSNATVTLALKQNTHTNFCVLGSIQWFSSDL